MVIAKAKEAADRHFRRRFGNRQNGPNPTIRAYGETKAAARKEIVLTTYMFSPAIPEVRIDLAAPAPFSLRLLPLASLPIDSAFASSSGFHRFLRSHSIPQLLSASLPFPHRYQPPGIRNRRSPRIRLARFYEQYGPDHLCLVTASASVYSLASVNFPSRTQMVIARAKEAADRHFSRRFGNRQNGPNPTIRAYGETKAAARKEIVLTIYNFSPAIPEVRIIARELPVVPGQRSETKGAL
jgi:hypothetical protein